MKLGFSGFAFNQIVGMGNDDINVTHQRRALNPEVLAQQELSYPKKLVEENAVLPNPKNGPEIAIYRREKDSRRIKENSYGGRIMPTYIFCTKEAFKKRKNYFIHVAKKFNTGTIIIVDKDAYKDIEISTDESKTSKPIIERKDSEIIKKCKEIIESER